MAIATADMALLLPPGFIAFATADAAGAGSAPHRLRLGARCSDCSVGASAEPESRAAMARARATGSIDTRNSRGGAFCCSEDARRDE